MFHNVAFTGTVTGGTFTLTYKGQTTSPIAFNAANGAVQAVLAALSSVPAGAVAVYGGPGPATPYRVLLLDPIGSDAALLTASGASLVGTTPGVAITTGGEVVGRVRLEDIITRGADCYLELVPRSGWLDADTTQTSGGHIYMGISSALAAKLNMNTDYYLSVSSVQPSYLPVIASAQMQLTQIVGRVLYLDNTGGTPGQVDRGDMQTLRIATDTGQLANISGKVGTAVWVNLSPAIPA